jgi:peptidoglycan/xylan/chitin deacetylase (PgdA/CDA1 family)
MLSSQNWPNGAKFALFLSHDIDKIHDREPFYMLGSANHIRRIYMAGEHGNARLALWRLGRSLFAPKPPELDFQTILDIESRYGFRSTFFVLHDRGGTRKGSRYSLKAPALRRIVKMIEAAGGEIGLHGGYYRFNQAEAYRESRELLRETLGVEAIGIRNHFLRFSGTETWLAQESAGFKYDATFGYSDRLGPREGRMFPFIPEDHDNGRKMNIVELPLTVMDITLFRNLGLDGKGAVDAAWQAIAPVIQSGGLVSLLWHNDYFNEPEYSDWQAAYQELLARLAEQNPWCATGAEIAEWVRER